MEGDFYMENENVTGNQSRSFHIYDDIKERTNGEIYIGIVGPVRTGKSTFIKNFMESLVIPQIENDNDKKRAIDELPQSGTGKTITTTEPKFIPKEAIEIEFTPKQKAKVRLIDCVGFMVEGATGHLENDKERMVKTPWSDKEIPFSKAAQIGTKKVITDHSTIGLVITTDGSISDIPRKNYEPAEQSTIEQLKIINKPFLVLVNSTKPFSEDAKNVADEISKKYNVVAMPVNCQQIKKNDINRIMEKILNVFPITTIRYHLPVWTYMLDDSSPIRENLFSTAREILEKISLINDAINFVSDDTNSTYIKKISIEGINIRNGIIDISFIMDESYYYSMLSDMTGLPISNDYDLIRNIKELSSMKSMIDILSQSYEQVQSNGYAVMMPTKDDITIEKPELIKHGNKYGIKIKATASSVHLIKAPIESEIAPIVGTMEQAKDLIDYISNASVDNNDGIWETNIFGKSVEQLINEGISLKINKISDETQSKMQDTLKKIVNESSGGVICIII